MSDSEKKAEKKISQEEIKHILELPTKSFSFGGITKSGKYDEEKKMFFFIDEEGNLTGRVAKINTEPKEKEPEKPPAEPLIEEPVTIPQKAEAPSPENEKSLKDKIIKSLKRLAGNPEVTESKDKEKSKESLKPLPKVKSKKNTKKLLVYGSLSALVIVGGMFIATHMGGSSPNESATEMSDASLDKITVIQVKRDMIPGDIITEKDIQKSIISAESYNEITLGDSKLYQWDRHESLIDKYVVTYIPKGQYMTYANIDAVYNPPANPWTDKTGGYELVNVKVPKESLKDEKLNYGSSVNITITKKSMKQSGATEPKPEENNGGLEHQKSEEQSYIIDTYVLSNTVCDLVNKEEKSLYPTFVSWIKIPAGEQSTYIQSRLKKNKKLEERIQPAYITVKVTKDQAEMLKNLLASADVSIQFAFTGELNTNTEARTNFAAEAQSLFKTIDTAKEKVKKETENEKQK